jgi:hypothetical protein
MFALDEQLAGWEAQLAQRQGPPRLELLAALAWHLRQRSPARARSLALEAAPLVARLPERERRRLEARFMLIEGEARWLFGELDAALALAERALGAFGAHDDAIGSADAHWLRSWIDVDRGDSAAADRELAAAAAAARRAGDPVRRDVFDAAAALPVSRPADRPGALGRPLRRRRAGAAPGRARLDRRLPRHLCVPGQRVRRAIGT